ncbi:hypothetical protein AP059_00968 [Pseudomonas sp. TAA207]|nr:hypothetical protein AP059_00968 [Pseudomonas sp. TAA207]
MDCLSHHVERLYGRFAPGRSLALLVSDYTEFGVAVAAGDVRLRSGRKSTDCDVERFYGRFAPGRSFALLVSGYTELGVAVAAGDARLRSGRKPVERGLPAPSR